MSSQKHEERHHREKQLSGVCVEKKVQQENLQDEFYPVFPKAEVVPAPLVDEATLACRQNAGKTYAAEVVDKALEIAIYKSKTDVDEVCKSLRNAVSLTAKEMLDRIKSESAELAGRAHADDPAKGKAVCQFLETKTVAAFASKLEIATEHAVKALVEMAEDEMKGKVKESNEVMGHTSSTSSLSSSTSSSTLVSPTLASTSTETESKSSPDSQPDSKASKSEEDKEARERKRKERERREHRRDRDQKKTHHRPHHDKSGKARDDKRKHEGSKEHRKSSRERERKPRDDKSRSHSSSSSHKRKTSSSEQHEAKRARHEGVVLIEANGAPES